MHNKQRNRFRQLLAITFFWVWWGFLGTRFWKSPVLFAVYPGEDNDYRAYGGKRFVKLMAGMWPVFPLNRRKIGNKPLALTVAAPNSIAEMESDPEVLTDTFQRIATQAQEIGAITVALAGRLPGVAHRLGVPLPNGFCSGVMGTCYTCIATVEQYIASKKDLYQSQLVVAVVGVGYTGRQLTMHMLARNGFKQFIGLDVVDRSEEFLTASAAPGEQPISTSEIRKLMGKGDSEAIAEEEPKLIITKDPSMLDRADIVIVLTAAGADMRELVRHIKPDAVVFDDTHPQMPRDVIAEIGKRTPNLFKMAMTIEQLDSWPPLPKFSRVDLEGCMVEATVVARNGGLSITDMNTFHDLAVEIGIRPRYPKHLLR